MRELVIRKCLKCGSLIEVIKECKPCGMQNICCGQPMVELKCNNTEFSFEKHMPKITKENDKIKVVINHPMEENHYIEWIMLLTNDKQIKVCFKPGEKAECEFPYVKGSKVYSYCNLHNLWVKDVE